MAAPKGLLPIKSFQEMMMTIAALSRSAEFLPDAWICLTQDKMEQIGTQLSADNENIDWRSFLLQASQPWPMPTQTQLLSALKLFQEMDQRGLGVVTREQFNEVNHWLKEWTTALNEMASCDAEDGQQPQFSRMPALVEAFFDIFADHSDFPPLLRYVDMLMYFSLASDPFEGLLRALSVVTGQHMPRLEKKKLVQKKETASEGVEGAEDAEKPPQDADKPPEDEATFVWPEDIPQSAIDAKVTLDNFLKVILHGKSQHSESNRFILHPTSDAKEVISKERLANIFMDLGAGSEQQPLPLTVLLEHPIIQDLIYSHSAFKFVDLAPIVSPPAEIPTMPEPSENAIAAVSGTIQVQT